MPHPVLLFDGVCNLCNGAVNFVIDHDAQGRFRFASLQSEAARPFLARAGLPPDYRGSLVLIEGTRAYVRSDAALEVARRMDGGWPLVARVLRLVPRSLCNRLYDLVARRRYAWFGRRDACRLMTPALRARFLA